MITNHFDEELGLSEFLDLVQEINGHLVQIVRGLSGGEVEGYHKLHLTR